jgi:hypothetical protein
MGFNEEERQSTGNRSTEKQPMPEFRVCPSGLRTFCRPIPFASRLLGSKPFPPVYTPRGEESPRGFAANSRAEVFAYRAGENAEIVTVPDSTESRTIFDGFNDLVHAKMLAADKSGDETNYLCGKALENARRIALILAVSRAGNPLKAKIGAEDAEYAVKLVDYLISTIIDCVAENLSENADEKAKKRILKVIGTGGMKGIMRSEFTRKTQFIRRNMREEYLADLIDSGEVVARGISDRFNHGETLYLASFAPQK